MPIVQCKRVQTVHVFTCVCNCACVCASSISAGCMGVCKNAVSKTCLPLNPVLMTFVVTSLVLPWNYREYWLNDPRSFEGLTFQ